MRQVPVLFTLHLLWYILLMCQHLLWVSEHCWVPIFCFYFLRLRSNHEFIFEQIFFYLLFAHVFLLHLMFWFAICIGEFDFVVCVHIFKFVCSEINIRLSYRNNELATIAHESLSALNHENLIIYFAQLNKFSFCKISFLSSVFLFPFFARQSHWAHEIESVVECVISMRNTSFMCSSHSTLVTNWIRNNAIGLSH